MECTSPKSPSTQISPESSYMIKIIEILTCPLCKNLIRSPIYSCKNNNHIICSQCSPSECPVCAGKVTSIRNPAVEAIADLIVRSCRYMHEGCLFQSSIDSLRSHEKTCSWKPLGCNKCQWSSNLRSEHILHMKEEHRFEVQMITLKKPFRFDLYDGNNNKNTVCNLVVELRSAETVFFECEKRSTSFFFRVRILPRFDKVYDKATYDRSILFANDEWKQKKLIWYGFVTKLSQDTLQQNSSPFLNLSELEHSATQLERGKKVSESSWELIWNIKKLSINGFVNLID